MKFALIRYKVEADLLPGLRLFIEAESHWHATEVASKKWGIAHKYISTVLAQNDHA